MSGTRFYFLTCFCLGFSLLIFTSLNAQRGIHYGVSGSFNSTWIVNQNNSETLEDCSDELIRNAELSYDFTWGYTGKLDLGYNITNEVGVQFSIAYNKAGQNYSDQFTAAACPDHSNVVRKIGLTYIQVPIQLKYLGKYRKDVKFFAMGGPQFGYLISKSEYVEIGGKQKNDLEPVNEKFISIDMGLAWSFGLDAYMDDRVYVSFGLDNYLGLLDINGQLVRDFTSKNDNKYSKSFNFRTGVNIGIHYLLYKRYRNSWN